MIHHQATQLAVAHRKRRGSPWLAVARSSSRLTVACTHRDDDRPGALNGYPVCDDGHGWRRQR